MIETERLKLISCTEQHFETALESHAELGELLGVGLAEDWLVFPEGLTGGLQMLRANPANVGWGTYLFVHKKDNRLIGSGGFFGAVDANGKVEIGYALSWEYQGQGLATEAARGLVDHAFSNAFINMVDARTLAEWNPSTGVLKNLGFAKIAELNDPADGDIWQWRLTREEYEQNSN